MMYVSTRIPKKRFQRNKLPWFFLFAAMVFVSLDISPLRATSARCSNLHLPLHTSNTTATATLIVFPKNILQYIVGFRKEMVNASLLNGKGEITDLNLNCAAINEQISAIVPFIEIDSIHISKVAFQVTSWTNLRKAPILVDIEHITVQISEPLHYVRNRKRPRIRHLTVAEAEEHFRQLRQECLRTRTAFKNPNQRGGYNLGDRIADNLQLEIASIYIQFQTWGTFKTRRPGPWTPPTIQILLKTVRCTSVDEYGNEGTPDDHWAHNHKPQPRGQDKTLLIFKKITMNYNVGLRTSDGKLFSLMQGETGIVPPVSRSTTVPPTPPRVPKVAPSGSPEAAAEVVADLANTIGLIIPTPDAAETTDAGTVAAATVTTEKADVIVAASTDGDNDQDVEKDVMKKMNQPDINAKQGTATDVAADKTDISTPQKPEEKRSFEPTHDPTHDEPSSDARLNNNNKEAKKTESLSNPVEDHNNQVVVHMAMKRRIRDGALLALQIDNTLSKVEVSIQAEVVPYLVQVVLGVQSCVAKDRGFEDPLRSENDHTDHNDALLTKHQASVRNVVGKQDIEKREETKEQSVLITEKDAVELIKAAALSDNEGASACSSNDSTDVGETTTTMGANAAKELVAALEGGADSTGALSAADSLSVFEETIADTADNDTLDGSTVQQLQQQAADASKGLGQAFNSLWGKRGSVLGTPAKQPQTPGAETPTSSTPGTASLPESKPKIDRAVIMLPNGLLIHEQISVSVSVDRATFRCVYPSDEKKRFPIPENTPEENKADHSNRHTNDDDFFQIDSRGVVTEFIWPKEDLTKGAYLQASVSQVSIQERFAERTQFLTTGGRLHDPVPTPIEKCARSPIQVEEEDGFPTFQNRAICEDRLDMRGTYPAQAVGVKVTIDCQTREKAKPKVPEDVAPLPTTILTGEREESGDSDLRDDVALTGKSADDQSTAAKTGKPPSNAAEDEMIRVTKVTNDVGVDSFRIKLDCQSWCRVLRFALNESGGGFNPRWSSGEWIDRLTTDMLVHPNAPLELDDHLQPSKTFFFDENEFISSDLFNADLRITNCEICIPAAIQQNIRSCDIVSSVDNMYLKISSDLPRNFPSSKIGKTFSKSDAGDIVFPNDTSDFSLQLQHDGSLIGDDEGNCKSRSVFQMKLELGGFSAQIVPVIPFYLHTDPKQLCAPTSVKISFCFEGVPPESVDSNLVEMLIYAAIEVENVEINLDLDLLAGALSTGLHHFQVVKETVELVMTLFPANEADIKKVEMEHASYSIRDASAASHKDTNADLSSANAADRIKNTLQGRRVLFHRQLHSSRAAGGLKLGLFMQVSGCNVSLWRQNVSMFSPYRPTKKVPDAIDREKLYFPLIRLATMNARKLEVGLEVDFRQKDRRAVAKCSLVETRFSLCNLDEVAAAKDKNPAESFSVDQTDDGDNKTISERGTTDPGKIASTKSTVEESVEVNLVKADDEGVTTAVAASGVANTQSSVTDGDERRLEEESVEVNMVETVDKIVSAAIEEKMPDYRANEETESAVKAQRLHQEDPKLVNIFSLGKRVEIGSAFKNGDKASLRDESILLRFEERFSSGRSRSFAADLGTGGIVNLHVDHIETVLLLILEALVMPTWSRGITAPLFKQQRFPEKSVGALIASLVPGAGGHFPGWLWVFNKAMTLAFPADLRLFLLRVKIHDVLVSAPSLKNHTLPIIENAQKFALMLHHLDLTTWYFTPESALHRDMLSVVAIEKDTWHECIAGESPGVHHKLISRQSFHATEECNNPPKQGLSWKTLVADFEMRVNYLHANMSVSMENTLSMQDLEKFQDCFNFCRVFGERCVAICSHLRARLVALRNQQLTREELKALDGQRPDLTSHPISAACTEMEQSVRSAKVLLSRMFCVFDNWKNKHDLTLRQRDADLQELQRKVFQKERERIAAVAMASSPIAGWLRIGGTHQSGHRVVSTSTLWRYWAVLKMDMLIIYTGPGTVSITLIFTYAVSSIFSYSLVHLRNFLLVIKFQYKPVDFIFLRGARLRALAGGRSKWDLKRAFGIVEREGKTRFFVAETAEEYIAWTRHIEKVTKYHYALEMKEVIGNANSDIASLLTSSRDDESSGVEAWETTNSEQIGEGASTEHSSGKLVRFGSALKFKKQVSPKTNTRTIDSLVESGEQEATDATEGFDDQKSTVQSHSDTEQAAYNKTLSTKPQETPEKARSRLLGTVSGMGGKMVGVGGKVGGKMVGMGQSTGRWGSALLSVTKQKGKAVAEKARRASNTFNNIEDNLDAPSGNLHVISEKEDGRSWTCPQCTFINNCSKESESGIFVCGMCESPAEASEIEFDEPVEIPQSLCDDDGALVSVEKTPHQDRLGTHDSKNDIFRHSQSAGTLGGRGRTSSSDSATLTFPRTQSAHSFGAYVEEDETGSMVSDLAMDEQSEAARSAGGNRNSRRPLGGLSALGNSRLNNVSGALAGERKSWFSRLGSSVSNQEDIVSTHKSQPTLKIKNLSVDPTADFTQDENPPLVYYPLRKLDGYWFAHTRIAEQPSEVSMEMNAMIETTSQGSGEKSDSVGLLPKEIFFCIQLFQTDGSAGERKPTTEVVRSLSEVLAFHDTISECTADLVHHPLFYERSYQRASNGDMGAGLTNALGISPLDSVRLSGAILAGLLEAMGSASSVEAPYSHSAHAVMDFLNTCLQCPLPRLVLLSLSDLLRIPLASHEVWAHPTNIEMNDGTQSEIQTWLVKSSSKMEEESDNVTTEPQVNDKNQQPVAASTVTNEPEDILAISNQCMTELLSAEQSGWLALELSQVTAIRQDDSDASFFEPLLPTHVTEHLQESMHAALLEAMAERDEFHARLVAASVSHAHALEQEKKKTERLDVKLEHASRKIQHLLQQQRKAGPLFGVGIDKNKEKKDQEEKAETERLYKKHEEMQRNTDTEIVELCTQLSNEVASRTEAVLEVNRVKQSCNIERQQKAKEKEALTSELIRVRELLAKEQKKRQDAESETEKWKEYYERLSSAADTANKIRK